MFLLLIPWLVRGRPDFNAKSWLCPHHSPGADNLVQPLLSVITKPHQLRLILILSQLMQDLQDPLCPQMQSPSFLYLWCLLKIPHFVSPSLTWMVWGLLGEQTKEGYTCWCPLSNWPRAETMGGRDFPFNGGGDWTCDRTEGWLDTSIVSASQGMVEVSRRPGKGHAVREPCQAPGCVPNWLCLQPWSHHESLTELMFIDAIFC